MCVRRLTPARLHLVFPSMSICLFHFHAPRLIQIKLSFMFLSHSPRADTRMRRRTNTERRPCKPLQGCGPGCQRRREGQFYLLNLWKCNYRPVWTCLSVHMCVCVCVQKLCRTYSEVSERRPLNASAATSEIWFLLRSLRRRREGDYMTWWYVSMSRFIQ